MQDLVARRLEIIGEAVKNLSVDIKDDNPDIPWRRIAGMRDILIHSYFGIDLDLTWGVVTEELPTLKDRVQAILEALGNHE